jgi:DNA polymerase-3 subunit epsilon
LVSAEERAAHRDFIATLGDNAIWRQYLPTEPEPEETLTVEQLPAGTVAEITAAAVAEVLGP